MRGGGSRSSLRTASSASSRVSRLVAGKSSLRATSRAPRGHGLVDARHRYRDNAARQSVKLPRKPSQSLVAIMPTISTSGTRHALLEIGERGGDGAAAIRIMAAIEPQLAARRRQIDQPSGTQALQPRGQSALTMPASNAAGEILNCGAARNAAMARPAFSN